MTNDELNYWLCLWYHHEILGLCVKWTPYPVSRSIVSSGISISCKCGKFKNDHEIPDHLNDPAVILGIIKELKNYEPVIAYNTEKKVWEFVYHHPHKKDDWTEDESLERAVMLALKAKVENR